MEKQALITVAALVVMLVWVGEAILGSITGDYTGFQLVTPIMLLFASYVFWRQGNGGSK